MSSDTKLLASYYARRWTLLWEFNPHDLWVGVYWKREHDPSGPFLDLYICLLPMLPLNVGVPLRRAGG